MGTMVVEESKPTLSHIGPSGRAVMVDVGHKSATVRTAIASAIVSTQPSVLEVLFKGELPKGDAIGVARIAGVLAAKRTAELIPLCHPLSLEWVDIEISKLGLDRLRIVCTTKTVGRTGVEMEALTGATVAALTVYDMAKSADKRMVIGPIKLESKTGGKSGDFTR